MYLVEGSWVVEIGWRLGREGFVGGGWVEVSWRLYGGSVEVGWRLGGGSWVFGVELEEFG